jgi:hypothetical protein
MIQWISPFCWVVFVAFLAVGLTRVLHYGMRPKGYPPGTLTPLYTRAEQTFTSVLGPPTLPLIGNLHQLPRDGILHLKFQEWAKQCDSPPPLSAQTIL